MAVFAACAMLSLVCVPLASAGDGPDLSRYVTVKFDAGASSSERLAARAAVGARFAAALSGARLQQISLGDGAGSLSATAAADALESDDAVEFAVPSGTWQADAGGDPYFDDPMYPDQWSLENTGQVFMTKLSGTGSIEVSGTPGADIGAPLAWAGVDPAELAAVPIGIVDTGVAYQHPDLAANAVPGKDFVDDDDDPRDLSGHGTHVASTAAGVADNAIGTAGVDPWAKVMPLRAGDEDGDFSWAAIEQSVAFGLASGVRIFNGSFGGIDEDPALEALIADHPEALFVFSAGNGGSDRLGDDHDRASGSGHRYPCDIDLENVICVGASDADDAIATFSDFGVQSVDLLAPGVGILAAKPCFTPAPDADSQEECPFDAGDPYAPVGLGGGPLGFQLLSGTSMSSPIVSGVLALIWGKCPDLAAAQVKRAVVTTLTPIAAVSSKVAYGGRLNAAAAVASVSDCAAAAAGSLDWPVPPEQPAGPGGDGGGDGGSGGGGGGGGGGLPVAPVLPGPAPAGPAADGGSKFAFRLRRPKQADLSRAGKVGLRLYCSAACSARFGARPRGGHVRFAAFSRSAGLTAAGTRVVTLRLPARTLRQVRAQLARRVAVRLRVEVVVRDAAGLASGRKKFSVQLVRR